MKKHLLIIFSIVLLIPVCSFAGNQDLFKYDKAKVEAIFSDLNEIEDYINLNEGTTLSTINSFGDGLTFEGSFSFPTIIEPPLGVPSIVWGLVLGPIGVGIVYFMTEKDNEETKKSFYGCIANALLSSGACLIPGLLNSGASKGCNR